MSAVAACAQLFGHPVIPTNSPQPSGSACRMRDAAARESTRPARTPRGAGTRDNGTLAPQRRQPRAQAPRLASAKDQQIVAHSQPHFAAGSPHRLDQLQDHVGADVAQRQAEPVGQRHGAFHAVHGGRAPAAFPLLFLEKLLDAAQKNLVAEALPEMAQPCAAPLGAVAFRIE